MTGKLDRVFTMTDEQVYKDARKDESRRQAYKLLAALREVCEREGEEGGGEEEEHGGGRRGGGGA